jgi:hypothetical protein
MAEISQTEIPTFSQLRRRRFLWHDRRLKTTKTETAYTKTFTPRGGDELYELDGVPGIWHESCLRVVS